MYIVVISYLYCQGLSNTIYFTTKSGILTSINSPTHLITKSFEHKNTMKSSHSTTTHFQNASYDKNPPGFDLRSILSLSRLRLHLLTNARNNVSPLPSPIGTMDLNQNHAILLPTRRCCLLALQSVLLRLLNPTVDESDIRQISTSAR